jgi:hypothetical protein
MESEREGLVHPHVSMSVWSVGSFLSYVCPYNLVFISASLHIYAYHLPSEYVKKKKEL